MGRPIVIYGKSGSGKSRSLKNFSTDEIQVFNVLSKDLPFKSTFTHVNADNDYNIIKQKMSAAVKNNIKVIVVDDCSYLMSGKYLDQCASGDKRGSAVFDFYNSIAHEFWDFVQFIKKLPNDINVYLIMHEDKAEDGEVRVGCIGKQLAEKTKIWEWVTIALRCESEMGEHFFLTKTDGMDITKSPEDMFDNERIPNDLKEVDLKIREYYGILPKTKGEN